MTSASGTGEPGIGGAAESAEHPPESDLSVRLVRWLAGRTADPTGRGRRVDLVCGDHLDSAAGQDNPVTSPGAALVIRMPGCLADLPRHVVAELLAAGATRVAPVPSLGLLLSGCPRRDAVAERFADLVALLPDRLVVLYPVAGSPDAPAVAPPGPSRSGLRRPLSGRARRVRATATTDVPLVDANHLPVQRRSLFGLSAPGQEPATSTSDALPHPEAPQSTPNLPDVTASDHARLLRALTALLPRDSAPHPADPHGPGILLRAGRGSRGTGCTACRICVATCPEGALSLRPGDELATLALAPARCSGCRACLDACPEDVLTLWRQARWSEQLQGDETILPLTTVHTTVCDRCGAHFAGSQGDVCEVCAFRRDEPFGSHLPPAAVAIMRRNAGLGAAPPDRAT